MVAAAFDATVVKIAAFPPHRRGGCPYPEPVRTCEGSTGTYGAAGWQCPLSGQSLTFQMVRRLSVAVVVIFVVLAYLYGPAAQPRDAQRRPSRECNDHAEGNWRSFRLTWNVGVYPHWTCWDASEPTEKAVSLGWWTNPFQS